MSAQSPCFSKSSVDKAVEALIRIGRTFYDKNWSLATSSNYSVVVQRNPLLLVMTASGKDKGRLTPADFVVVNDRGAIECGASEEYESGAQKPSAETMIHLALAANPSVGAVLHTHSVYSTILSARHASKEYVEFAGFEMLKAFNGVTTHDTAVRTRIFQNTQNIPELAEKLSSLSGPSPGFLIEKHGLYAYGGDVDEAQRHIEAFEFLFEVLVKGGGAHG